MGSTCSVSSYTSPPSITSLCCSATRVLCLRRSLGSSASPRSAVSVLLLFCPVFPFSALPLRCAGGSILLLPLVRVPWRVPLGAREGCDPRDPSPRPKRPPRRPAPPPSHLQWVHSGLGPSAAVGAVKALPHPPWLRRPPRAVGRQPRDTDRHTVADAHGTEWWGTLLPLCLSHIGESGDQKELGRSQRQGHLGGSGGQSSEWQWWESGREEIGQDWHPPQAWAPSSPLLPSPSPFHVLPAWPGLSQVPAALLCPAAPGPG